MVRESEGTELSCLWRLRRRNFHRSTKCIDVTGNELTHRVT